MNLNDDVVYRCRRLGALGQLHPGRSRSLIDYHDRLHVNCLLGYLSLCRLCSSDKKAVRHLMPGAMGSFRKRRWHSVTSLLEMLGARQGLTSDTSASTTFAVGPAGAASLIYANAAMSPRRRKHRSSHAVTTRGIFHDLIPNASLRPAREAIVASNRCLTGRGILQNLVVCSKS
jgi:hypothetical protein